MKHIHFFLSFVLIFSTNLLIAQGPTFGNTGEITICVNGSYYLNPSTPSGTFSTNDPLIATVNSSGYVTAGAITGTTIVSFVDGGSATVSATVNVVSSSSLNITDPLAQASYKFNNNPQGPIGGINNYVGYNGYDYSSQARPINTGFIRASKQSGNAAGCPYAYYIFSCSTCGTVPEYATRPQGTLTGNTILPEGSTGQLTYTSSNSPAGGPFTIVYLPNGGSNVTVNNISSTVAFNVASGTPISTTTYTLISVTDENTKATTDFTGIAATITVTRSIGESYGGGIVFYVTPDGLHGLIAAPSDEVSILSWADAITACSNKTIDVYYSDWYLPFIDELNLMYTNIGFGPSLSSPNYNKGGFALSRYWSSTEDGGNSDKALYQEFSNGLQNDSRKTNTSYVRAIRSF
jgi:hypothetical protein